MQTDLNESAVAAAAAVVDEDGVVDKVTTREALVVADSTLAEQDRTVDTEELPGVDVDEAT